MNSLHLGIKYVKTALTAGKTFAVKRQWHPKVDAWSPMYSDIKKPFDFHKYTSPRLPINLGKVDVRLVRQCPNVLRVPIKWSGSTEVKLPKELLPISGDILRLMHYDHFVTGPMWKRFFCHLTIHNEQVQAGQTHRYPGFHGDGLMGGKFKHPEPTVVAVQPFFVAHLNENRDNVFKAFDQQAKPESQYRLKPACVYLIDPYVVHKSPIITKPTFRTFLRLTTTSNELLMPKNTVNPMFEGQDYPARLEVREFVTEPDPSIPLDFYGITPLH